MNETTPVIKAGRELVPMLEQSLRMLTNECEELSRYLRKQDVRTQHLDAVLGRATMQAGHVGDTLKLVSSVITF